MNRLALLLATGLPALFTAAVRADSPAGTVSRTAPAVQATEEGCCGTSVRFEKDRSAALQKAGRIGKLVFVVQLAGVLSDPHLT